MNAEIEAVCDSAVPFMYHTAQLWEKRWWGLDKIGVKGTFTGENRWSGSAYSNDVCKINHIRSPKSTA